MLTKTEYRAERFEHYRAVGEDWGFASAQSADDADVVYGKGLPRADYLLALVPQVVIPGLDITISYYPDPELDSEPLRRA